MGGTAIGTGLNARAASAALRAATSRRSRGKPITLAPNLVEATQDTQAVRPLLLGAQEPRDQALEDLQRPAPLSSGPRAGSNEINLPPKQPGSSIMPGKVNPVIPRSSTRSASKVIGNDLAVTMAAEAGQLQLNVMEPVIAACIFESQTLFMNAARRTLRVECVDGHHGKRRRLPALRRGIDRSRDGAQPGHRLREGDRARRRGADAAWSTWFARRSS
jgi:aspartate ammonia-lyase